MSVDPSLTFHTDQVVQLRRAHPCGGRDWRVTRVGDEIGLACLTCGRRVFLPREELARRCVPRSLHIPGKEADPAIA